MIERIIAWSIANRVLVLLLAIVLAVWGTFAVRNTPLDAIPDLSDVQVIIHTPFGGQAPQVVEDQVTYPLSTAMLSVPGASDVRGFSFFGDSYVYVLFEDGTDPYWARSRVQEYLGQIAADMPQGATPRLGPDATGVGWIYMYALADRTGSHDLADLRSLQDWFLQYELQSVPGVSEVATLGGMVRQYQVVVDPDALRAHAIPVERVADAIRRNNRDVGGALVEMGEAEYMVRSQGALTGLDDLRAVAVGVDADGTPLMLGDVAELRTGPRIRRGIAELDGEGEVVGGIVVMRDGGNALATIDAVKQRLDELRPGLPAGVEIIETYDRSTLIRDAVDNLAGKLWLEFAIIAAVSALFLFHLRSALVAIIALPLGVMAAFVVMSQQGINANIMSLGGIAITIGAMVDAAIVMIENAHKRLERAPPEAERWTIIGRAATEAGRPLFFALLIITVSFLPLFTLEGQEGRLFAPLAFTGSYAMAAAAGLSVTLVPVLMGYLIRGRIHSESTHPISRVLIRLYRPVLRAVLARPRATVALALALLLTMVWPVSQTGSEFMPVIDEGDLMYMPSLDPGASIGTVRRFVQQSNRLIRSVPEVEQVFGKTGRAETATDPAPLGMLETIIRFRPADEWREGMSKQDIIDALDERLDFPGISNTWVQPIRTRIDMLATGLRTPVGVKIAGPDLAVIADIGRRIEAVLADVPGTASAFAERTAGGRYVDIDVDRAAAARHGLSVDDVQGIVGNAIGGMDVAETVEGLERYPVSVRYPVDWRDSLNKLEVLPIVSANGNHVALGDVASLRIADGPPMIKSENARPNGWVFVDIRDRDLGSYVEAAREAVRERVALPAGYALSWAGQYEYMQRARERLQYIVPVTLVAIFLLLYLCLRNMAEPLMLMAALPFALTGGAWVVYALGYEMSVAVAVGFILLTGLTAMFGIIMLVYIDEAMRELQGHQPASRIGVRTAIMEGAALRVRPKAMTVSVIVGALLPIMLVTGTGSEVMQRIAAPMIGGMITAPLVSMLLIPALYYVWYRRGLPELPDQGDQSSGPR